MASMMRRNRDRPSAQPLGSRPAPPSGSQRPHQQHLSLVPSFLQSPSHARSNSASASDLHTHSHASCLHLTSSSTSPSPSPSTPSSASASRAGPLDRHTSSTFTAASTASVSSKAATSSRTKSCRVSAQPCGKVVPAQAVYPQDHTQRKRISQRYSSSAASSYTSYSSALAASYQQHQQQLQLHHHTHPINQPTYCTLTSNASCSMHDTDASNSARGNKNRSDSLGECLCSASFSSNNGFHRLNSPPSPCLNALDSTYRPSSNLHDSSALPSPSLSVSSTDSVFSSASSSGSTSMAHCSPILQNTISTILLHDLSWDASSTSSPVSSSCNSPRVSSSSVPSSASSSLSSSPSPSPSPMQGRTRRASSLGSRTSQTSQRSQSSQASGYFNLNGTAGVAASPSVTTSRSSTTAAANKRRSLGTQHYSSPLARSSTADGASLRARTAEDGCDSPQAVAERSARYIRFLLLPLIPLLLLALGGQTSTTFKSTAHYV